MLEALQSGSLGQSSWLGMATSLAVIAAAELGDKTQLVCMTLAARHRPWPVLWGVWLAFALLNGLAVAFGAAVAAWLPKDLVALAVAGLFLGFGVHALRAGWKEEPVAVERTAHGLFFTAFTLIFLAEFGDKTQIAVAGLSTAFAPAVVWTGATLGLGGVSALGVLLGRTLLKRLPIRFLHRISGGLFLLLAGGSLLSVDWRALWRLAQSLI
ncbi:TMEM165/GDT1 family protein [Methylothermus subterraneus]